MSRAVADAIAAHSASGRRFEAGGLRGFALDRGEGATVLLLHGVPVSSFLYRKVAPSLAREGFRAVAPDLPGLGLSDRPEDFDYSWSGLARWLGEAVDALEIDRCHLVVHDIGGPIGCEWAVRNPERVLSLTALNTMLDVAGFRRPWAMHPFSIGGVGEIWLRATPRFLFAELVYLQGIAERSEVPRADLYAHHRLLHGKDRGRAFLRIMRGFELTEEKQSLLWEGLAKRPYPAQVVWGERDPALGEKRMRAALEVLAVEEPILLPAKHFLQEDQASAVAGAIAGFAAPLA